MSSFETSISRKLPLVSLISAIFIIYTNIAWIPWESVSYTHLTLPTNSRV
mgnify:CR=1 FL=1